MIKDHARGYNGPFLLSDPSVLWVTLEPCFQGSIDDRHEGNIALNILLQLQSRFTF